MLIINALGSLSLESYSFCWGRCSPNSDGQNVGHTAEERGNGSTHMRIAKLLLLSCQYVVECSRFWYNDTYWLFRLVKAIMGNFALQGFLPGRGYSGRLFHDHI